MLKKLYDDFTIGSYNEHPTISGTLLRLLIEAKELKEKENGTDRIPEDLQTGT